MKIDFHTHILPEMDDGSHSVDESLEMLRTEKKQGVDLVALTSHFYANQNDIDTFLKRRRTAWEQLSWVMPDDLPELRLGAEVHYFEGISDADGITRLCLEGTQYLLLEMPFFKWSGRMIEDIIDLNDRDDVQVVLAHIERYLSHEKQDIWDMLLRNGVMMQSNASFFCNWKTKHKAASMLRKGKIHIMGSDCHNMGERSPNLGMGYEVLKDKAQYLMQDL